MNFITINMCLFDFISDENPAELQDGFTGGGGSSFSSSSSTSSSPPNRQPMAAAKCGVAVTLVALAASKIRNGVVHFFFLYLQKFKPAFICLIFFFKNDAVDNYG